jgi:ATPase subunit of ABC transporter with duplicated ATPase domains
MILIGLNGVTKTYGGRTVLALTPTIGDEESIGLVGANGAGKSTLRILAG